MTRPVFREEEPLGRGAARPPAALRDIGPRTPQSSKLRAKVDCIFRLIDAPDGELVGLEDIPVNSVDIVRNRPGDCDTATVRFVGDAFPFDLRIIADKSMFLSVWLYEEQGPQPRGGGPGHFFGVVDDVDRERYKLTGSLSCRDMTAVPLNAFMPEDLVKGFEIERAASVETVVEALLRQIPGTYKWTVESLSAASDGPALPLITPQKPSKGSKAPKPRASEGKAHLSDLIPAERTSVWSAIGNVCARAGIVPEVSMGANGEPVVRLVDASDLQRSDVLRPFERGGRKWRVFVDGDGPVSLNEKLSLSDADDRPDYVEVSSMVLGKAVSARWPEAPAVAEKDKKDRGTLQFVPGISSQEALLCMARAGYESLCHNQYRVSLTTAEPWSAGGGPDDPDLLDLGYGAAVEFYIRPYEGSASEVLTKRGLSQDGAQRILRAQERIGALSLLFQATEVKHSWSAGQYRCDIGLRQFLGTGALPIFGVDTIGSGPQTAARVVTQGKYV